MNTPKNFKYFLMFSLVLINLLCFATLAQPTTYYVAKNGNNNWNGLYPEPGTPPDGPWLTIQKAADTLTAGDTVYIRAGIYQEYNINPTNSGSAGGGYIIYKSYSDEEAIIDSSTKVTGWVFDSAYIYKKTDLGFGSRPTLCVEDTVKLEGRIYEDGTPWCPSKDKMVQGSFYWDEANDDLYIWCSDDGNPNEKTITVNVQTSYFSLTSKSYIKFEDLTLRYSGNDMFRQIAASFQPPSYNLEFINNKLQYADGTGIRHDNGHNTVIQNNEISYTEDAIAFRGGGNNKLIEGNDLHNCSEDGIYVGGTNIVIRNNHIYNFTERGHPDMIQLEKSDTVLIENNIFHNCRLMCIFIDAEPPPLNWTINNVTIRNNLIYDVGTIGIAKKGDPTNVHIYNNTVWCDRDSIMISGPGLIIKNNIMKTLCGWRSGTISDYNCLCSERWDPIVYDGIYMSWENYLALSGQDTHSLFSSDLTYPKFVDAANHDFHLQPDSPCKGTGENGVDMGAYGVAAPEPHEPDSFSYDVQLRNRPNPFRAGKEVTLIEYNLKQPSSVTITIYDLLGQEVWRESYQAGENGGKEVNSVPWDGRNLSGKVVANGGYICRIWIEREKRYVVKKVAVAK